MVLRSPFEPTSPEPISYSARATPAAQMLRRLAGRGGIKTHFIRSVDRVAGEGGSRGVERITSRVTASPAR